MKTYTEIKELFHKWPYLREDTDGEIVQSSLVLGLNIFKLEKTK